MADKNHWHPAFVGATEWELKENKKDLTFEPEHQLSKEQKHRVLRILRRNAERSDVERFLLEAQLAKDKDDLQNIDAVLQVSVAANKGLYEELRKEDAMCQALRDLMSDEIEKERNEGRNDAIVDNIKSLMQNMKWTAEQAMKALGISDSDQSKYIALL